MVDRKDKQAVRKTVLMHTLAAYGADPRRWPPGPRGWLDEGVEGDDAELAKGLGEARDLDRLLDAAEAPRVPAEAAERAVAAILSDEAQGGDVVSVDFLPRTARARPGIATAPLWSAAALAAALVLGIYFGASGLGEQFIPPSSASTSVANTDYDIVNHVLTDLQEDMG